MARLEVESVTGPRLSSFSIRRGERPTLCKKTKGMRARLKRLREKAGEISPCATRSTENVREKKPGRSARNDVVVTACRG